MNIIEKLQRTILAVDVPFVYGSQRDINDAVNRIDLSQTPIIATAIRNSTGALINENGDWRERVQFAVEFLTKTEHDAHPMRNEELVQDCKEKAMQWLIEVTKHGKALRLISVDSTARVYEKLDCYMTGFALYVTMVETEGVSACDYA